MFSNFYEYYFRDLSPWIQAGLFYIPETIFFIDEHELKVESYLTKIAIDKIINQIHNQSGLLPNNSKIKIKFRETKQEYVKKINQIKEHIQKGDIYEMNYCQEFYSFNSEIIPEEAFIDINNITRASFSCF